MLVREHKWYYLCIRIKRRGFTGSAADVFAERQESNVGRQTKELLKDKNKRIVNKGNKVKIKERVTLWLFSV